jgi:hypothetical protein
MFVVFCHDEDVPAQVRAYYIDRTADGAGPLVGVGRGLCDLSVLESPGRRDSLALIGEELINMSYQQLELPPF